MVARLFKFAIVGVLIAIAVFFLTQEEYQKPFKGAWNTLRKVEAHNLDQTLAWRRYHYIRCLPDAVTEGLVDFRYCETITIAEVYGGLIFMVLISMSSCIYILSSAIELIRWKLNLPKFPCRTAGNFVAVRLHAGSKRSNSTFIYSMAEVVDITSIQVTVKYMVKQGNSLYAWPPEEDYSTQPITDIIGVVSAPKLINAREQFQFLNEDIQKIEMLLKNQKVYFK